MPRFLRGQVNLLCHPIFIGGYGKCWYRILQTIGFVSIIVVKIRYYIGLKWFYNSLSVIVNNYLQYNNNNNNILV